MKLGIFAKTLSRPTIREVFGSIASYGINSVQFNLSCARPRASSETRAIGIGSANSSLCRTGKSRVVCDLRNVQHGSPRSRRSAWQLNEIRSPM